MRAAFWKIAAVLVVSSIGMEVLLWNTATAEDTQPAQRAVEPTPSTPRTAAVRKPATPQPEIGAPTQYRERRKPQGNSASKISNTTLSVSGGSARTATSSGKPKTSPSAGGPGPISQVPHAKSVGGRAIAGANGRTTTTSAETTAQRGEGVGAMSPPGRSADVTGTLLDPSLLSQSPSTLSSVSQFQGFSANSITDISGRSQAVGMGWINSVTANPQMQNAAARGFDLSPSWSLTATQSTQGTQSATPGSNSNTEVWIGSLSYPSGMPASLISPNSTPPETERSDQVLSATGLRNTLLSRDLRDPSVSDNSEEGSLPIGSDLNKDNLTGTAADVVHREDAQSAPESRHRV